MKANLSNVWYSYLYKTANYRDHIWYPFKMLSDSESIIYHFCKWKTGNEEKMSCQLNLLSRIKDNQVLRKFINPLGDGEVSEQSQESDGG